MAFATIDVTKAITGTIPVANGGTGLTSGTTGQFLKFTGTTTVASSAVSAGKVLQVVEAILSSSQYSTSSSYSTVLTASITPSATSSKILVLGSVNYNVYGNGSTSYPNGYFALNQEISGGADTQITENQTSFSGNISTDNTDQQNSGIFLSKLFSPNTTSQVDCKIRMKATAGRIGILGQSSTPNYSLINVLEIGA